MFYVDDIDALKLWRSESAENLIVDPDYATFSADDCMPAAPAQIDRLKQLFAIEGKKPHLMIPDAKFRTWRAYADYSICERELPPDSFIAYGKNYAVASPELCYLEMADRLDRFSLAILACELCGCYAFRPGPKGKDYSERVRPLTSVAKLDQYLSKSRWVKGVARARKALSIAVNNSWSPMESMIGIRLRTSCRANGYGMPPYSANGSVDLDKSVSPLFKHTSVHGDLVWHAKERDVVLEYNGEESHTGKHSVSRDTRRTGAMRFSGVSVIEVVKEQYNSIEEFEGIVKYLCREIGINYRKPSPETLARREEFRKMLWSCEREVKALDKPEPEKPKKRPMEDAGSEDLPIDDPFPAGEGIDIYDNPDDEEQPYIYGRRH